MKWVLMFALIIVAVMLFVVGTLLGGDPEGRGGKYMLMFWGGAAGAVVTAICTAIWG